MGAARAAVLSGVDDVVVFFGTTKNKLQELLCESFAEHLTMKQSLSDFGPWRQQEELNCCYLVDARMHGCTHEHTNARSGDNFPTTGKTGSAWVRHMDAIRNNDQHKPPLSSGMKFLSDWTGARDQNLPIAVFT